ncbi:hypothetical protein BD626DRAFT_479079 [Schizophyllum amplum]|uniref:Uncharacterized protein n=1 Tax=Schizophyllum amplum TaxID=97359 RepID=A0A550CRX1_9AGAR|nr:hypothetical protein BD626DRAFT_479079 [Auriculariopsis ampla]
MGPYSNVSASPLPLQALLAFQKCRALTELRLPIDATKTCDLVLADSANMSLKIFAVGDAPIAPGEEESVAAFLEMLFPCIQDLVFARNDVCRCPQYCQMDLAGLARTASWDRVFRLIREWRTTGNRRAC